MGDTTTNDFAPFQMNYIYDAADEWGDEPWNVETKKCSESYDVSTACGMRTGKDLATPVNSNIDLDNIRS